jgi:MFS family permease
MEAFASRDFRLYQLARGAGVLGSESQSVAVAWQVYSLTHRPLDLGYTGLALFLPGLFFMLPAGHVADRFDRRQVVMLCYALQFLCTAALFLLAFEGTRNVFAIYSVLFFIGTGRAFSMPAGSALVPHLVPEKHFVNAVTWGGAVFQFANVTGPAIGGVLYTLPLALILRFFAPAATTGSAPVARLEGAGIVYLFSLAMLFAAVILVVSLRVRPGRMEKSAASLNVVLAGFRYLGRAPMLLGSISLDLFVMLLGGAVALMPIFANEILHAGPIGLGMLRAAPSVGAVAMSLTLTRYPIRHRAGRRLFMAVAIFGAAMVAFGLSRSLWLSLAILVVSGAADMNSVIIRNSLLQLATPPQMRGRVSAVNSMFIGASNELGSFESGLTAQWWGAIPATIIGGIGSLVVAGLWSVVFPSLSHIDKLDSQSLLKMANGSGPETPPADA